MHGVQQLGAPEIHGDQQLGAPENQWTSTAGIA